MKILAVGCHPDDLEIGCYGTLAKYVKMGHEVAVCHVANGNLGHMEIAPAPLREMRFQEAEAAAKVIGAAHYSVDIGDLFVTAENDELIRRLAAVVREVQPDLIITHNEQDYMNDHMQTYYAVLRASFGASLPHFDVPSDAPISPTCPIYHMDPVAGTGFIPTEYVDITSTIDLKLEALSCHKSQIVWMLEHDHIDFLDFVKTCSRVRGFQSGVDYAEGFRPNLNYLRITTKRLLP
ncbi:MAG: PIG-L deacetylase family protein [Clostridia bacterium]